MRLCNLATTVFSSDSKLYCMTLCNLVTKILYFSLAPQFCYSNALPKFYRNFFAFDKTFMVLINYLRKMIGDCSPEIWNYI